MSDRHEHPLVGDNFIKMMNETPSELETHSNGTLVCFGHLEAQFVHGQTGQRSFCIRGHDERFVVWSCAGTLWRAVKLDPAAYSFEHSAWSVRLV